MGLSDKEINIIQEKQTVFKTSWPRLRKEIKMTGLLSLKLNARAHARARARVCVCYAMWFNVDNKQYYLRMNYRFGNIALFDCSTFTKQLTYNLRGAWHTLCAQQFVIP